MSRHHHAGDFAVLMAMMIVWICIIKILAWGWRKMTSITNNVGSDKK